MALLAQSETSKNVLGGLDLAGQRAYGSAPLSVPALVGALINVLLGVCGLILVALFVYGGVLYMTAQGDADRVKTAKRTMINAVIGIVIVVAAYATSTFVVGQLASSTSGTTSQGVIGNVGAPCSIAGTPGTIDSSGACVQ